MDHQWCPGDLASGQSPDSEKGLTLNEDQAFFIGRTAQSALASRAARVGLRACAPVLQLPSMASWPCRQQGGWQRGLLGLNLVYYACGGAVINEVEDLH